MSSLQSDLGFWRQGSVIWRLMLKCDMFSGDLFQASQSLEQLDFTEGLVAKLESDIVQQNLNQMPEERV